MTVLEACRWAEHELADLESSRMEAELILCHLMNWRRHSLYLNRSSELNSHDFRRYRKMVVRRRDREPLSHISGSVEFLGREYHSGPGALVPRPETEVLVLKFLEHLQCRTGMLLDVGTGSANIAVSLALACPDSMVIASDISLEALLMAARNRDRFGPSNLFLVGMDMLGSLKEGIPLFDGIIGNLPYIPSEDIPTLQPEVRKGDPLIALDGGPDGLDPTRRLADTAPSILRSGGLFSLELSSPQVPLMTMFLENRSEWKNVWHEKDLSGRSRIVMALRA